MHNAKLLLILVINNIFLHCTSCVLLFSENNTSATLKHCSSTNHILFSTACDALTRANNINEQPLLSSKPLQSHKSKFSHFDCNLLQKGRERERRIIRNHTHTALLRTEIKIEFSLNSLYLAEHVPRAHTTPSNKIYIFTVSWKTS